MKKRGLFIVVEGTDGSGKGTQVRLLVDTLVAAGHAVEMLDFPQYELPSSFFVQKYLRGEYGTAEEVGAKRASVFYALDRYDKSFDVKRFLKEGKIIISNRYVSANMGHQTANIKGKSKRDEFLKWLHDLEYKLFGIPQPDATIFLHVKPEIAQQMVDKKIPRAYIRGQKRDLLEADLDHLRKASEAYKYVAKKYKWKTIECVENNTMLPIEEIHQKIYTVIKKLM